MLKMYFDYLKAKFSSKKGQGMVEYGLIIGLVAIAVITVLGLMGGQVQRLFQSVTDTLTSVHTPT